VCRFCYIRNSCAAARNPWVTGRAYCHPRRHIREQHRGETQWHCVNDMSSIELQPAQTAPDPDQQTYRPPGHAAGNFATIRAGSRDCTRPKTCNRRRSEVARVDRGAADSSAPRGARRFWMSRLAADRRETNRHPKGLSGKWLSVDELDPPLGAHLGTPRFGYLHHGIYVGGGYVVHYAGYLHGFRRGPVEEVELARFRDGRSLWVAPNARSIFDRREVTCRARSRIGESRYRLLTNNCEHFCEWCLNGEQRSYQVEALLAWRRRALAAPLKVASRLLSGLRRANRRLAGWLIACPGRRASMPLSVTSLFSPVDAEGGQPNDPH
jgi:hypothetical protein